MDGTFMDGSPDCSTILLFGLIRPSMPMRHGLSGVPGGPYPLHCLAVTKAPPIPRRLFHIPTKRNVIPNLIREHPAVIPNSIRAVEDGIWAFTDPEINSG